MTDPTILLDREAPDGVEMLVAWLTPIAAANGGAVGAERQAGDPLPYWLVSRVATADNVDDKITDRGTYSVHSLSESLVGASDWAKLAHRRVLVLGPPLVGQQRVTISGGRIVMADSVTTDQAPFYQYYSDTIRRYVGRYDIDLRFVAV